MNSTRDRGGLSRLLEIATKAVEQVTTDQPDRGRRPGSGTDTGWRGMVRKAADAVGATSGHPAVAPGSPHPRTTAES